MDNQNLYWDNVIKSLNIENPKYDLWLDKYNDIFSKYKHSNILELGCGWGSDTLYLTKKGYNVIACDFSVEALKKINKLLPQVKTFQFDISKGIPFEDNSTNIIIADLCLHYFSWDTTKSIVNDISRVLSNDGYLFCRVNSNRDVNFGSKEGQMIENNYYLVNGCTKRFFDKDSLIELFNKFNINCISEYTTYKYHKPKVLWEVCISKK